MYVQEVAFAVDQYAKPAKGQLSLLGGTAPAKGFTKGFDETLHPRQGVGAGNAGQFRSKPGSTALQVDTHPKHGHIAQAVLPNQQRISSTHQNRNIAIANAMQEAGRHGFMVHEQFGEAPQPRGDVQPDLFSQVTAAVTKALAPKTAAPGVPGEQMGLFGQESSGQGQLFNVSRPKPEPKKEAPKPEPQPEARENLPGQLSFPSENQGEEVTAPVPAASSPTPLGSPELTSRAPKTGENLEKSAPTPSTTPVPADQRDESGKKPISAPPKPVKGEFRNFGGKFYKFSGERFEPTDEQPPADWGAGDRIAAAKSAAAKSTGDSFAVLDDNLKNLNKLKKAQSKADENYQVGSSRARATTHAARQGNRAKEMDSLKSAIRKEVRGRLSSGKDVPKRFFDSIGSQVDYNDQGNYDPINVVDDGPKDGDRDKNGLVFRNGRWHRDDVEETGKESSGASSEKMEVAGKNSPMTSFKQIGEVVGRLKSGDMTADELRSEFERFQASRENFEELLKKKTVKQLKYVFGNRGSEKKADIIRRGIDGMERDYHLGDTLSYGINLSGQSLESAQTNAIRKDLAEYTDETIKEFAAGKAAKNKEASEREAKAKAARQKRVENPETVSDWHLVAREAGGYDKLSPKRQAEHDDAIAALNRSQREPESEVRGLDGGKAGETAIVDGHHSKSDKPTWTVTGTELGSKATERMPTDEWRELAGRARELGGKWVNNNIAKRYGATEGFQFFSKDAAESFQKVLGGEAVDRSDVLQNRKEWKEGTAAQKLRLLADSQKEKGEASAAADRKDNTERRARMAASAEAEAQRKIAFAETLHNIADALDDGKANHLSGIRTMTQVDTLYKVMQDGQRVQANQAEGFRGYEKAMEKPFSVDEHSGDVPYPYPSMNRENLKNLIGKVKDTPGLKMLSKKMARFAKSGDGNQAVFKDSSDIAMLEKFVKRSQAAGNHEWAWNLDHYKRLQSADIKGPEELRAAVREFAPLRGKAAQANPVKVAERALRGREPEGFFPTPKPAIDEVLGHAAINPGERVLEPGAGKGDILDAVKGMHPDAEVVGLELNQMFGDVLSAKGHEVEFGDFLEHKGEYDKIVMNPPFERDQAIDHVKHAHGLLSSNGKVVSVIPGNRRTYEEGRGKRSGFAEWVDSMGGDFHELPEGTFKGDDSFRQTGVSTSIVVIPAGSKEKYSRRVRSVPSLRGSVESAVMSAFVS